MLCPVAPLRLAEPLYHPDLQRRPRPVVQWWHLAFYLFLLNINLLFFTHISSVCVCVYITAPPLSVFRLPNTMCHYVCTWTECRHLYMWYLWYCFIRNNTACSKSSNMLESNVVVVFLSEDFNFGRTTFLSLMLVTLTNKQKKGQMLLELWEVVLMPVISWWWVLLQPEHVQNHI